MEFLSWANIFTIKYSLGQGKMENNCIEIHVASGHNECPGSSKFEGGLISWIF